MSSKLSICIPTYNRPLILKKLHDNFLKSVLNNTDDQIEIIVCDNSDLNNANINATNLDQRIKYFANKENIGFAGNFLRCIKESSGEFIWIISDDDDIKTDDFFEFWTYFLQNKSEADCFMIPYETKFECRKKEIFNTKQQWNCQEISTIGNILETNEVPFILFSTGIIRNSKKKIHKIKEEYIKNAYIQVIAFLTMMEEKSTIRFYNKPLIVYQPGYIGQTIGVLEMSNSLLQVREFLKINFRQKIDHVRDYEGWLLWLLHHRGGSYILHNGDEERKLLIRKLPKYLSIKSLLLTTLLVFPKWFIQLIYPYYESFLEQKKNENFNLKDYIELSNCIRKFNKTLKLK